MTTTFRQIEKENPGGQIPVALSRKLRRFAGEHRRGPQQCPDGSRGKGARRRSPRVRADWCHCLCAVAVL